MEAVMNAIELTSDEADLADFEAYITAQTAHMHEPDRSDCQSYLRARPGDSLSARRNPC
jgi:hypothetical protein